MNTFLGTLIGVWLLAGNFAAAVEIALRPQAMPTNGVVRLGDVAEIRAADTRQAQRLSALPLMPAPPAGATRFLRSREIADMLAAQGEDVGRIRFTGAAQVAVKAFNTSTAKAETSTETSRLTIVGNEKPAQLSDQLAERRAALAQGRVQTVEVRPNQKQENAASAPTPQPVVVATRPIERGALITAADAEVQLLENAPVAMGRRTPLRELGDLVGMEAGRAIQAGDVIFNDQVKPPLLVKRGETITVVAQGGGIQVRTTARARQDGVHGDLVQIESLETKERYDARVIGLREAAVLTATQPTAGATGTAASASLRPRNADEVTPFRKFLPANQQLRDATARQATAFRNYVEGSSQHETKR